MRRHASIEICNAKKMVTIGADTITTTHGEITEKSVNVVEEAVAPAIARVLPTDHATSAIQIAVAEGSVIHPQEVITTVEIEIVGMCFNGEFNHCTFFSRAIVIQI